MNLPLKRSVLIAGAVFVVLVCTAFWLSRISRERHIPPLGGERLMLPAIVTTNYLQRDPRWMNETVGGSGETLSQVGCTVCGLAMALGHYGIPIYPYFSSRNLR